MSINKSFSIDGVETYLFDLDNTLYHASTGLMDAMMLKMTEYVADHFGITHEEAKSIRVRLWQEHGTTLCGLMKTENIDALEFLDYVHNIDLSCIEACNFTREGILGLDGRKVIFTNADLPHADRVLKRLGLDDVFEEIYDVTWADYRPKPDPVTYERLVKHLDINPSTALMLEDSIDNLKPAHDMGMKTVLIHSGKLPQAQHDHVHHMAPCMPTWLSTVTKADNAA